ncbi:hypothetical protein EMIT0215P_150160 [Pseudomonas serboccidentalis]
MALSRAGSLLQGMRLATGFVRTAFTVGVSLLAIEVYQAISIY